MKRTRKEANAALVQLLSTSALLTPRHERDLREIEEGTLFQEHLSSVSFRFEVPGVWGAEATLDIRGWDEEVYVSWSSTTRTVSMSLVTLDLYQKVTLLAARVKAFMESVEISDFPKA